MSAQEQRMLQAVEDSLGPAIVDANVLAGELEDIYDGLTKVLCHLGVLLVRAQGLHVGDD